MSRNRNWCFTLNNYSDEDIEHLENGEGKYTYLIYGKEVGESGTPHLQGYVEFENPRFLGGVKKIIGAKAHLEIRRGTARQAREYCMKEGSFKEIGEMSAQGARADINEVKEKIIAGEDYDDVVVEHFELYCKYKNGFDKLNDITQRKKKRTEMTKGLWLWGETGVGKSHTAYELAGDDVYTWTDDNGWWDGYKGQKTVVINDFRGSIKYNEMLQLVDKWPHSVRRRGREPMPFTSELVIVTSSLTPGRAYPNLAAGDGIEQILRRFEVKELKKKCLKSDTPFDTEVLIGNTVL